MTGSVVGDGSVAAPALVKQWVHSTPRTFRCYVDKITPHTMYRWIGTLFLVLIYALRIYFVRFRFYVVSFLLALYTLLLFLLFSSSLGLGKPNKEVSDGPLLPIKDSDEFKPFLRHYSEFKCWYSFTIAICVAFIMTFCPVFDICLFYSKFDDCPIPRFLVVYWIWLFAMMIIAGIIRSCRLNLFNFGKKKYGGVKPSSSLGTRTASPIETKAWHFLEPYAKYLNWEER